MRGEAETPQVLRMEMRAHFLEGGARHGEGNVAVAGTQLEQPPDPHPAGALVPVGDELGARLAFECAERAHRFREPRLIETPAQAGAAHGETIRHADPRSEEHTS